MLFADVRNKGYMYFHVTGKRYHGEYVAVNASKTSTLESSCTWGADFTDRETGLRAAPCLDMDGGSANAVSEGESSSNVQFSANKVEGQGKCQAFLRQAMLSQTTNCELFTVGRRV